MHQFPGKMRQFLGLWALVAQLFLISTLISILSIGNAVAAGNYMDRFNIPANHIQLEWAKSGSGLQAYEYKGKTYKWLPRKTMQNELVPLYMQNSESVSFLAGMGKAITFAPGEGNTWVMVDGYYVH